MSDTSNVTTKVCSQCHIEKPVYEFHRHSREKDGYRRNCKECRAKNGECNYIKPAPPGYQWCRKCNTLYPATTEFFYWNTTNKRLYSSCKRCHCVRTRDWINRNHDKHLVAGRRWMQSHPENMRRAKLKWWVKDPETHNRLKAQGLAQLRQIDRDMPVDEKKSRKKQAKAKRRTREMNAEGSHTYEDLLRIYDSQEGRCAYCGVRIFWDIPNDLHVEHIKPLSRGGSNWPDNICLSCADCNLSKSDKTVEEWELVRGW